MSGAERVLLDPPEWPGLGSDQLTAFVEAVHTLLDLGIFRPPLAAELVRYRDAAAGEISARIAAGPRGPAGKDITRPVMTLVTSDLDPGQSCPPGHRPC